MNAIAHIRFHNAQGLRSRPRQLEDLCDRTGRRALRRTLDAVRSQRSVIDYSLARRAILADLFAGRASTTDACDAHPYLLRAAKHHGEATEKPCPVCRKEKLTHVTYVYGDELREYSGRVKATAELADLDQQHTEFTVYVVEVCRSCSWNHLTTSYVLGSAAERPRRARRRAAEE